MYLFIFARNRNRIIELLYRSPFPSCSWETHLLVSLVVFCPCFGDRGLRGWGYRTPPPFRVISSNCMPNYRQRSSCRCFSLLSMPEFSPLVFLDPIEVRRVLVGWHKVRKISFASSICFSRWRNIFKSRIRFCWQWIFRFVPWGGMFLSQGLCATPEAKLHVFLRFLTVSL